MWLWFSNYTRTQPYTQSELMTYFCRFRLRLPVQLLILFWASRWFMPSVAMPSIDRTKSPTAIPPFAAFPPSVSCRDTKTANSFNYLYNQYHRQKSSPARGCCGKLILTLYLSHDLWIHYRAGPLPHDGGSPVCWCMSNGRSLHLLLKYLCFFFMTCHSGLLAC